MEGKITKAFSLKAANWMNRYAHKSGLELTKMELGMEIFLINVIKLIIMYSLAIALGILLLTFSTHMAFVIVKRYSFGLHAANSTICTIVSCCMFVVFPCLLAGTKIGNFVVLLIFAGVIFALFLFAPADTKARPLIGATNRRHLRRKSVISGLAVLAIALLIPNETIKLMIAMGAVYQSITVLPVTYKILGRSVQNYEKYETDQC